MDYYLRNNLNDQSVLQLEEAAKHNARLLPWLLQLLDQMQDQKYLELSASNVECMFKVAIYIAECHARHGEALTESMLLLVQHGHASIRSYYDQLERNRQQCLDHLCSSIMNSTCNGHQHICLLYQLRKLWSSKQDEGEKLDWSLLSNPRKSEDSLQLTIELETQQMRQLVSRLYRLSTEDELRLALNRALELLPFQLWMELWREPVGSLMYERCLVLRHMICDMLEESTATSQRFVQAITAYLTEESSSSNVYRFYRCMSQPRFVQALCSYCHVYWQCETSPAQHMIYLTHLLLASKSPCRVQLFNKLRQLKNLPDILALLSKMAFIYN
ncbi:uncharacterized protein LOC108605167 [Drosophila busckii]|uniref:uncharacterized protein LOC108605167 n=1 Tax=Drosophila busckii TaxID=30019 RepID=UPI00083F4D53|nr:uncharacterized protein LOC108605167 [Drosophila busckii]